MTIIITSLINSTFPFAENCTDILNLSVHILTWEMWWRISCLPCTTKLSVHALVQVILRKPSSVAHICKFVRVLQSQGTCLWQAVGATLTLHFALSGQITMSRIVTDGGRQHSMQSEVLIDDSIPNLHTFPKELKIFDEGLEEHNNSITELFRSGDQCWQRDILAFIAKPWGEIHDWQ